MLLMQSYRLFMNCVCVGRLHGLASLLGSFDHFTAGRPGRRRYKRRSIASPAKRGAWPWRHGPCNSQVGPPRISRCSEAINSAIRQPTLPNLRSAPSCSDLVKKSHSSSASGQLTSRKHSPKESPSLSHTQTCPFGDSPSEWRNLRSTSSSWAYHHL
ncbi:hypothetical protein N658DRAFT_13849 [Parathielavia hyrcaniae]|uniref:Uncharacterized protein n=1 Tax=Parathielavia hyrcaniae TaxID=113614 RepID=A0AAN6QB38_9PEZI|nr:hypothetical protein N658DRAFT_13849 [Parathielavia hyrcaniae]